MITSVQLLLLVLHVFLPNSLFYYRDEVIFSLECVFVCFPCPDVFFLLLNVVPVLRFLQINIKGNIELTAKDLSK
jgi:hypothetical protein